MNATLGTVWTVFALVLLVAAFWHHSRLNQVALRAAIQHAEQQGLQLLDQSVILQRLRLKRDRLGALRLERRYRFEFSLQGDRRFRGWITLLGRHVARVESEPFPEPGTSPPPIDGPPHMH